MTQAVAWPPADCHKGASFPVYFQRRDIIKHSGTVSSCNHPGYFFFSFCLNRFVFPREAAGLAPVPPGVPAASRMLLRNGEGTRSPVLRGDGDGEGKELRVSQDFRPLASDWPLFY